MSMTYSIQSVFCLREDGICTSVHKKLHFFYIPGIWFLRFLQKRKIPANIAKYNTVNSFEFAKSYFALKRCVIYLSSLKYANAHSLLLNPLYHSIS